MRWRCPAAPRRSPRMSTAPPALARRLAQIGVVADAATAERLQPSLRARPAARQPRRRAVALGRLPPHRRHARPPPAQRLRQRNRLAELGDELARRRERGCDAAAPTPPTRAAPARRQAGEVERAARQADARRARRARPRARADAALRSARPPRPRRASPASATAPSASAPISPRAEAQARRGRGAHRRPARPGDGRERARRGARRSSPSAAPIQVAAPGRARPAAARSGDARASASPRIATRAHPGRARAEAASAQRAALERAARPASPPRSTQLAAPPGRDRRRSARRSSTPIARRDRRGATRRPTRWPRRDARWPRPRRRSKAADAALGAAREERVRCRGAARPGASEARDALAAAHPRAARLRARGDAGDRPSIEPGEELPPIARGRRAAASG